MGHDSGEAPRPTAATMTTAKRSALSPDEVKVFTERAPRCHVSLQVLCTVPGEGAGMAADLPPSGLSIPGRLDCGIYIGFASLGDLS